MSDSPSLWYKDAIFYTLHVRSFFDSTGNGIGDINGLIQKLDYLEDLGVTCLSLLPFYPSPLRDDGYDVMDYLGVHPEYGTTEQFQQFVEAAHARGLKVVIDLVASHTSIDHPYFQRARLAPEGSPERDFYVWSNSQEKYQDAAVLFPDDESSNWAWDNVAKAYYFHRFYSHQADLNYENPLVRERVLQVLDHWLGMGVDGVRLIGVAYTIKQEGTNCENLPEVHTYLKDVRRYVDKNYPGRILLTEANLWPEEAAEYYGNADECQMNFHFPLMPRLFMALQTEDRYPIIDILEQTPPIPDACQWALFLRNHDDLTLSMVTEEERDYLYRMLGSDPSSRIHQGIRRRLAPLLGNDQRKIELLNTLLFSLPGAPVLYYGDEIGMGDNIYLGDRKGIRTPMQWNSDRNAGFSTSNPQRLFLPIITDPLYRYEAVNVENQNANLSSLLWWMKNLIAMRKRLKAFSRGEIHFLEPTNTKILAFTREYRGESILVVVNLSKFSQAVELDLSKYKGVEPTEIFSQNKFFAITEDPYRFTVSPYGYYWFLLEAAPEENDNADQRTIPELEAEVEWSDLFTTYSSRRLLEKRILPNYLPTCRWFAGKSRKVVSMEIQRAPKVELSENPAFLMQVKVRYTTGLPETYSLPLGLITDTERSLNFLKREKPAVVAYLKTPEVEGIIVDAIYDEEFRNELFWLIKNEKEQTSPEGLVHFEPGKMLRDLDIEREEVQSEVLRVEQSNTSVIYNGDYFFKIYRKLDTDINPDLELVRFLSDRTSYTNSPRYGGGIAQHDANNGKITILGLLQNKIPNQGEAWTAMLDILGSYYERVLDKFDIDASLPPLVRADRLYFEDLSDELQELVGKDTFQQVTLLAKRTGEMHIALASDEANPDFRPVDFTRNYQRSVYSAHRKLVAENLDVLADRIDRLPESVREEARELVGMREKILEAFKQIYGTKIDAVKTRIHGDYHLGQVLFDGKDFFIIDFEGEPMLSISERRLKRTPFKDVAGIIRSFHYAALGRLLLNPNYRKEDFPRLEAWARQWYHYVSRFFLTAYLDTVAGQAFVPSTEEGIKLLLRIYSLEKAIYEVGYEMNSRPDWLRIPVRGVLYLMEDF